MSRANEKVYGKVCDIVIHMTVNHNVVAGDLVTAEKDIIGYKEKFFALDDKGKSIFLDDCISVNKKTIGIVLNCDDMYAKVLWTINYEGIVAIMHVYELIIINDK